MSGCVAPRYQTALPLFSPLEGSGRGMGEPWNRPRNFFESRGRSLVYPSPPVSSVGGSDSVLLRSSPSSSLSLYASIRLVGVLFESEFGDFFFLFRFLIKVSAEFNQWEFFRMNVIIAVSFIIYVSGFFLNFCNG